MLPTNNSLKSLTSKVKSALERGDIDTALRLVHNLVERVVTEPICTAQVFASRDLDNLCMQIGSQNLHGLTALRVNPWPNRRTGSIVVHLVSRLQRSGGHSRLTQDFINAQPEKNHLVLSTEIAGQSDRNYYTEHFANYENVLFLCAPRGNFATRLTWLQEILLFSTPEDVYLLNHHQDSVAIAALVPELVTKGSFIHHADHHLCLGVHLNHLVHVDLHPMGFHYCRDELGVVNRYLPLTFEDKCCVPMQTDFMHGGCLTTATAARSNKVEIPYYVSYLDTIPDVLKATGGHHIHIGRLTPWGLRRIRSQMRKFGIPKERFVYIEWVPSVWQALQQHRVDVYIASFPYGAGLTLIEAMGAGIPVIMHKHMYSRVLSSLELAYPGAFSWDDPADLLRYLSRLLPDDVKRERKISRWHYENFHRPEILRAYFRNPTASDLPVPPLVSDFKPRHDEWATWTESQLSFYRLCYRFAYRSWRRLRGWASI